MAKKYTLQQFGFQESQYDRPNQPWVCGRLCEGRPCHIGPDDKGHCQATSECHPVRKGDRWHCTRPPSRGGACKEGPLPDGSCCKSVEPCQPTRSVRAMRGKFVFWVVALTVGFLAAVLASPSRMRFIQPGELTNAHGQVLKDVDTRSCAACHSAAAGEAIGETSSTAQAWVKRAFSGGSSGIAESENCLKCHSDTRGFQGQFALMPHGVPPTVLEASRETRVAASGKAPLRWMFAKVGPDVPMTDAHQIACSTCHKEHRGADHLLTHMSNQQCQACHVDRFESFASGHPEFSSFPYERRTRIKFTHEKHKQYFETNTVDFDCASCHQLDSSIRQMTTKPFEQSCTQCHNHKDSLDKLGSPIIVINLPGLDIEVLRDFAAADEKNPWIGYWPPSADYGLGTKLSPMMKLLLMGDAKTAAALEALPQDLDLNDLRKFTPQQLKYVTDLVWGIKGMMLDLAQGGADALRTRLAYALGRPVTDVELSAMTATLPRQALVDLQESWFPDAAETVPLWRAGKPVPGRPALKPREPEPTPTPTPSTGPKPGLLDDLLDEPPTAPKKPAPGLLDDLLDEEPAKPTPPPATKPVETKPALDDLLDEEPPAKPAPGSSPSAPARKPPKDAPTLDNLLDDRASLIAHPLAPQVGTGETRPQLEASGAAPSVPSPLVPPPVDELLVDKPLSKPTVEPGASELTPVAPDVFVNVTVPLLDDTHEAPKAPPSKGAVKILAAEGAAQFRLAPDQPWQDARVGIELPASAEVRTGVRSSLSLLVARDLQVTLGILSAASVQDLIDRRPVKFGSTSYQRYFGTPPATPRCGEESFEPDEPTYEVIQLAQGGGLLDDDDVKPAPKQGGGLLDDSDDEPKKPAGGGLLDDDDEPKKPAPKQGGGLLDDDGDEPAPPPVTPTKPKDKPLPTVAQPLLVSSPQGVWEIKAGDFKLLFQPRGHGNRFRRFWLNAAADAEAAPKPAMLADLFNTFTQDNLGAACIKCHSVDAAGERSRLINWQGHRPPPDDRTFVKFAHRPHMSLPELKNCVVCHTPTAFDSGKLYEGADPHAVAKDQLGFRMLQKMTCATCHQKQLAGDSCLKCHNYHISAAPGLELWKKAQPARPTEAKEKVAKAAE